MKKLEKLKLNEMQDFTAIEKNESLVLKGGAFAATLEGWNAFMDASHYDETYNTICGSGTKYVSGGKEYWTELRVIPIGGYYSGQFLLGSCSGSAGIYNEFNVDSPTMGTNWETYYGSYFGDSGNVQWF